MILCAYDFCFTFFLRSKSRRTSLFPLPHYPSFAPRDLQIFLMLVGGNITQFEKIDRRESLGLHHCRHSLVSDDYHGGSEHCSDESYGDNEYNFDSPTATSILPRISSTRAQPLIVPWRPQYYSRL